MKKIKPQKSLIFALLILLSVKMYAGDVDTSSYITRMLSVVNQNIGKDPIMITTSSLNINEYTRTLTGRGKYWGIDDVEYSAIFNSVDSLMSLSLVMPSKDHIKLADKIKDFISMIAPDWVNLYLPEFIKTNLLFDSCRLNFDKDKGLLQKAFLDFEVLGFCDMFEAADLSLSKISIGIDIDKMDEPGKREISGDLAAEIEWAGTSIKLSSSLVREYKDWKLSCQLKNLTIKNIFEKFKIDLGDTYMPPLPFFDLEKGISLAQVDIWPASGVEFSAKTDFGDFNLLVKYLDSVGVIKPPPVTNRVRTFSEPPPRLDPTAQTALPKKYENKKGWGICAGYSFGENFTFKSFIPQLGFLDKYAQLNNKGVYFSTFTANPGNVLPVFKYMGSTTLYKGVTFIFGCDVTKLNLGPAIGKLSGITGVDYLCFQANIPVNPINITVDAAMVFNKGLNIAKRIYFKNIDLLFEANEGDPKFSIASMVDVKVTPEKTLQFLYKGSLEPFAETISGGGAMLNTWKNVFGFPNFDIGQLELGLGVNFSHDEIPIPDNLSIAGKISVGGIGGTGRIMFDANELDKNVLIGSVDNLTWNNFIGDFCTEKIINNIPSYVKPVFTSKLNHADIKLAPPGSQPIRTLTGEYINPGFRISADGEVAGWHGDFTVDLEGNLSGLNAGFTASGKMDPIKIDADGFKIFYFTAAQGKGGPEMKFDVSTEKIIKIISGQATAKDTINYVNAAVTILEIGDANAYCLLTPSGYKYKAEGKAYGFLNASLEAQIKSFKDPLQNTYVKVEGKTGSILKDVQKFVSKEVLGKGFSFDIMKKGFSLDRIFFEGKLDDLKSGVKAKVDFTIAGKKNSIGVNITVGGGLKLAEDIAKEIVNGSMPVLADIQKVFDEAAKAVKASAEKAAAEMKAAAEKAVSLAKNSTQDAINVANQAKTKLSQGAQTAFNGTRDGFKKVSDKTEQFFKDFGGYTQNTVEKIFNKSIDKLENGWSSFTDAMKKAFTGGDNEERIMVAGPAFRIITKYQNNILLCPPTPKKNFPISVGGRTNNNQETWQLIPNDKNSEGSFFLVSGYSGLLITKPWPTHLTLIPHESDHKDRERMLMEQVPNEPGWYYLKYFDFDRKNNVNYYTYAEVRNVFAKDKPGFESNAAQWVLAPVQYSGNSKPGDYGKFRFEKAADIDWKINKSLPPYMAKTPALTEGSRYQFNGEPEQYIYSNGTFRWIPDGETLVAAKLDAKPLTSLINNQKVSTVLGTPIPSRKDGALIRAQNEPEIFVMDNGMRRWIPDRETFNMMGLNDGMIQSVSKADLLTIPTGEPIPSKFAPKTVFTEKALYRPADGSGTVYIVINKILRGIPDPETLAAMGYNFAQVQDISAQQSTTLPKGAVLPSRRDGTLLRAENDPEVFIMEKGIRRSIPDIETFNDMSLNMANVKSVSRQDLLDIPQGPKVVSEK